MPAVSGHRVVLRRVGLPCGGICLVPSFARASVGPSPRARVIAAVKVSMPPTWSERRHRAGCKPTASAAELFAGSAC